MGRNGPLMKDFDFMKTCWCITCCSVLLKTLFKYKCSIFIIKEYTNNVLGDLVNLEYLLSYFFFPKQKNPLLRRDMDWYDTHASIQHDVLKFICKKLWYGRGVTFDFRYTNAPVLVLQQSFFLLLFFIHQHTFIL